MWLRDGLQLPNSNTTNIKIFRTPSSSYLQVHTHTHTHIYTHIIYIHIYIYTHGRKHLYTMYTVYDANEAQKESPSIALNATNRWLFKIFLVGLWLEQVLECDLIINAVCRSMHVCSIFSDCWRLFPPMFLPCWMMMMMIMMTVMMREALGRERQMDPSSFLPPATGLTFMSLESMIPVNTLIMARPGCAGPATPCCAAECWGSRVDMIDSYRIPRRRAAFQQGKTKRPSKKGRWGGEREQAHPAFSG